MTTYDHRYEDRRSIRRNEAVTVACCWALLLVAGIGIVRMGPMMF